MTAAIRVPLFLRLFAAVLVLSTPVSAATLYVSTTGSDANPGTLQAPVATPARALALAAPGDTILLRGGTYNIATPLQLVHAGMTLASYPGERARLVADTSDAGAPTIVVIYASRVTVAELELQGGSLYGIKVDDYFGAQTGIVIRGVYIHHTGRDGIKVQKTDDILIENSAVAYTGVRDRSNADGIDIMGAHGATVRYNLVHDIGTTGIYVKAGTRQAVIEGNRVERTGYAGILLGSESGIQYMRDGVLYEAIDSVARNNIIVDPVLAGLGSIAGDNVRFENNTVINAASGGQSPFRAAPNSYNTSARNVVLKNNIFVLSPASTRPMVHLQEYPGGIVSDSNIWYHAGGKYQFWREYSPTGTYNYWSSLSGWSAGMNVDWKSRAADPRLDAATLYLPLDGSPAIDAGEALPEVTSDYAGLSRPQGPAHDIGAREKAVATPTEPPPPANVAPSVTLTSPSNGATFTAPATLAMSASAADSDGTVARVDFYSGGTLLGSDTSSPYAYTLSNVPAGSYTLTARAIDNAGAIATSAGVGVTVSAATAAPSLPSPWQTQDIGAVGVTGTATASNGVFTVEGGGADIWGTADALRYVWQPITGDVDIVARVASIEYVHAWVKSGVMIRERLTADSAQAMMLVSPGKGLAFQRRTTGGGLTTSTSGGTGTAPEWVKLERRGNTITAYYSPTGTSWTRVGSDTFVMGASAYVGLAVSSHSTSTLATSTFDGVTVTIPTVASAPAPAPAPSLPSPWQTQDIGAVGVTGTATASNGVFTVEGGGADIWGTADALRYVWQPITGDVDIVARVASIEYVHAWVKSGVMIRERLTADSAQAMMLVSPGKGLAFQRRTTAGGLTTSTSGGTGTAPEWVKLERRGNTITAYYSPTGTSWTRVGSDTFVMGASAYVGLAVSSHSTSQLATTTFDGVTVTAASAPAPALPAPWTSQDIGAVGLAGKAVASNGTFSVDGGGLDVWGTADAFQYVWQPLSGDGDIIARVASVENLHAWVKAGVMIRERLTADSPHAFMIVSPGKGLAFQRRVTSGGISVHTTGGAGTAPAWIKLERRGNVISAYRSADGVSWTFVGNDAFTMGTNVYVGLAVSGHSTTALATATFDGVVVR